jgi:ribosomal protein S27AE
VFTPDERLSLLLHWSDHVVATCCGESLKYQELAADLVLGRQNFCPRCGRDLTDGVREHLGTCARAVAADLRAQTAELR